MNNVENKIIKNVFSDNQINLIYNTIDIEQKENTSIVSIYAQKVWFIDLPNEISQHMQNLGKEIFKQNVTLDAMSFARYSNQYGNNPNLTPHYDNAFLESKVTIDVQLRSNINWPLVVQGKSFTLKDNDALIFSGTHQIHWREHKKFNNEDFIEMLFCHFSLENKPKITIEEIRQREKDMMYYNNLFYQDLIKDKI
jgi:hypothetical protein